MKVNLFFVSLIGLFLLVSCSNNDDDYVCPPNQDPISDKPYGGIRKHSDCKNNIGIIESETLSTDECISYQYFPEYKILSITHINSGMNCDPGKLSAKINFTPGIISITESQEKSGARCECLYDIYYDLRNIEVGNYLLSISGPIIDGVNYPSFSCYIDLSKSDSGSFCITRGFYPWQE